MNRSLGLKGFNLDPTLFSAVIALLVLGIIMVSSASITLADSEMGEPHYCHRLFRSDHCGGYSDGDLAQAKWSFAFRSHGTVGLSVSPWIRTHCEW